MAKQFLTFVSGAPFQPADRRWPAAAGLLLRRAARRRCAASATGSAPGCARSGSRCSCPQGTYFVTADVRPLGYDDGVEFCRELPRAAGVVAIPHQVFYDDVEAGRPLVRFAFCKRDEVLDEALTRLQLRRVALRHLPAAGIDRSARGCSWCSAACCAQRAIGLVEALVAAWAEALVTAVSWWSASASRRGVRQLRRDRRADADEVGERCDDAAGAAPRRGPAG